MPLFGSVSHVLDCSVQGCAGQRRRWYGQAYWGCYQLDCIVPSSYESNQDPPAQLWTSLWVQDLANYGNQKDLLPQKSTLQSRDLRTEQRHRHDTCLKERNTPISQIWRLYTQHPCCSSYKFWTLPPLMQFARSKPGLLFYSMDIDLPLWPHLYGCTGQAGTGELPRLALLLWESHPCIITLSAAASRCCD